MRYLLHLLHLLPFVCARYFRLPSRPVRDILDLGRLNINERGPPPYPRLNESDPLLDFPAKPPTTLAKKGNPPNGSLLVPLVPKTTAETGLRVRRKIWSLTGRDLTVRQASGTFLYATDGDFWSMHAHTHFYDAGTGEQLAIVRKYLWSFRKTFDILTFRPICANQSADEEAGPGNTKLYQFARLTKQILNLYNHWTLERYECDGSMTTVWDVMPRFWMSMLEHYDFVESDGSVIGSMDQPYVFQLSANYDTWVAEGEDLPLFALTAMIVDMTLMSGGSGGGGSGGGGGEGGGHAGR
eukprot:TRINITY_DN20348_c0_g1_i1.p1 TRINITY_DN20348_c0_g1~~TRINITY_DN20348_c0_g1_i1.p1  ORF type:complete len:297 (-),score=27.68 TRINITY_DN20348_c0_g1_i1:44-934(-)